MNRLILVVTVLLVSILLTGCPSSVKELRDVDFTLGCKVIEAQAKLGYFNQEGDAVVCKVKCSAELPDDFYYKYDNNRTGCSIEIGTKK